MREPKIILPANIKIVFSQDVLNYFEAKQISAPYTYSMLSTLPADVRDSFVISIFDRIAQAHQENIIIPPELFNLLSGYILNNASNVSLKVILYAGLLVRIGHDMPIDSRIYQSLIHIAGKQFSIADFKLFIPKFTIDPFRLAFKNIKHTKNKFLELEKNRMLTRNDTMTFNSGMTYDLTTNYICCYFSMLEELLNFDFKSNTPAQIEKISMFLLRHPFRDDAARSNPRTYIMALIKLQIFADKHQTKISKQHIDTAISQALKLNVNITAKSCAHLIQEHAGEEQLNNILPTIVTCLQGNIAENISNTLLIALRKSCPASFVQKFKTIIEQEFSFINYPSFVLLKIYDLGLALNGSKHLHTQVKLFVNDNKQEFSRFIQDSYRREANKLTAGDQLKLCMQYSNGFNIIATVWKNANAFKLDPMLRRYLACKIIDNNKQNYVKQIMLVANFSHKQNYKVIERAAMYSWPKPNSLTLNINEIIGQLNEQNSTVEIIIQPVVQDTKLYIWSKPIDAVLHRINANESSFFMYGCMRDVAVVANSNTDSIAAAIFNACKSMAADKNLVRIDFSVKHAAKKLNLIFRPTTPGPLPSENNQNDFATIIPLRKSESLPMIGKLTMS